MKKIISLTLVLAICLFSFASCSSSDENKDTTKKTEITTETEAITEETTNQTTTVETTSSKKSKATEKAENSKNPKVQITVKNYGIIKLQLDSEQAPITVKNFVKLVKSGFYDGLTFHRIIKGFMIQGGDPQGTGAGGSDETIKGEFSGNGVNNTISHTRGTISMARSSDPNSASSQFFICDADSTYLDGQYAAFGKVTKGMDVIDKIASDAVPIDNNGTITKEEQPVIEKIEIIK